MIVASAVGNEWIELTDSTFESRTLATSGKMMDDWLILFCSPDRFQVCRDIEPLWQAVTDELFGHASVAFVDV